MLKRKIETYISDHLKSESDKILIIEGARQIGKSFIINKVGKSIFKNFIEINFITDDEGPQIYKKIRTPEGKRYSADHNRCLPQRHNQAYIED